MNRCILSGRLVVDPELKKTHNEMSVTNNALAVSRKFKDDKGNTVCDFINISAWGPSADYLCKYGHKGDMVMVSGAIRQYKYVDKDGNNRSSYEIRADELEIYSKKEDKQKQFKDELYEDGDMSFD